MNQLQFIKPKRNFGALKLSTQKSGKIAFSKASERKFDLLNNRFLKIGIDSFENLFIKPQKEHDENSFKISKRGEYYYLEYLELLNILKVKKGETIQFELKEDKEGFFKIIKQ